MTERVWYWVREKGKRPHLKQAKIVRGNSVARCTILVDGETVTRIVKVRHLFTAKPEVSVPADWQALD